MGLLDDAKRRRAAAKDRIARIREDMEEATLNEVREGERVAAHAMAERLRGTPEPLDEAERAYHAFKIVDLLVSGSERSARDYCRERGFSEEDSAAVIKDARDAIEKATRDKAGDELSLSVARYDHLFERAQRGAEPDLRTALRAQIARDRVTGVGLSEGAEEIVKGFAEVIARVSGADEKSLDHQKPKD